MLSNLFFKLFKFSTFTIVPISVITPCFDIQRSQETNDALNFIPFDDFYKKGYFNVDTSNDAFLLKGFNLDKKSDIQADINNNKYNALFIPDYVTSISSTLEYASIGAFQYAFSTDATNQQYVSDKITSVIFDSNSVCSYLGKYCFDHCNLVNFIGLSNSINQIDDHCFSSCTSLSTILLPNSLKTIPWYCFGCYTTETQANDLTISIPEGVETIDRAAFTGRKINSVTFPSTLKTIGDDAFAKSTVLSMTFLPYKDEQINSMSFNYSWASGIIPYDTQTNKIKVFLPKDKSSNYIDRTNFQFTNQEINNGLVYTGAHIDNPVFNFEFLQNNLNDVESTLRFKLFPYQDIYGDYMDSTAEYEFSCESTNTDVVVPNLSKDNIFQGKLDVSYKKNGSSKMTISETCNKLKTPLNFLSSFVKTNVDSLWFKNIQFNSYFLKTTDSPVTTPVLNDNVYDFYGNKISTDIKFSVVDSNSKTYTLPSWITLNETTGSLKISPNADSESISDIKIKVEQTTTGLIGYSDQFSIIIQSDAPTPEATKLIIDYDFISIVANPGTSISTPSLLSYIMTDTGEQITSGVNFALEGELPDGISFDSATGQIAGTLTDQSKSCFNLVIYASAKVGSETLSGESSFFSIIVENSPVQPTKLSINENIRTIYTKPNESVRTKNLNKSVTTDTSAPVTEGLNFSCDNLPTGFSIDNSTGVISCASVSSDVQDAIDLQIHVSAVVGSATLQGDSNYFSIIINPDVQPSKLIIDNDFQTIYVTKGQTISTPDLTNSIVTDYWSPVTTSLTFSCSSNLPLGLSFDPLTGRISGTIQAGAVSSANIQIQVEANVDGRKLYGSSNHFSIIVNQTPAIPTKLLFKTNMYDEYTFVGKAVSIDKDLLNNIMTDTGLKVNAEDHNLRFTLNGELPLGLSFNQTTGKISGKIFLGATSSDKLTITATANYDGNVLTGESNSFNIIVNNKAPSPTKLLINYDMETYYTYTNNEFTSPSLIHYVSTDLHDKITTNLTFSTTSTLPKGLQIDQTTGSISGKVIEDTIAPKKFELEIYVETTIEGKVLQGQTNTFTIVLNQDKGIKWDNITLFIITLMIAPAALAAIDTFISLGIKHLMVKVKKGKKRK